MAGKILGMAAGEVKNIILSAKQAYGPRLDENLVKVLKAKLGKKKNILEINLQVLDEGYKLALKSMKKAGKKEKV